MLKIPYGDFMLFFFKIYMKTIRKNKQNRALEKNQEDSVFESLNVYKH